MSDLPAGVPLIELLRRVPRHYRACVEEREGTLPVWRNIPYGRLMHDAADAIAAERERAEKLEAENERLRKDAERYRWLRENVKEEPLRPKLYSAEILPDTRLRWLFPVLMSWADYCGQIPLDEAIDAALGEKE